MAAEAGNLGCYGVKEQCSMKGMKMTNSDPKLEAIRAAYYEDGRAIQPDLSSARLEALALGEQIELMRSKVVDREVCEVDLL
jgi:hypothetical protein